MHKNLKYFSLLLFRYSDNVHFFSSRFSFIRFVEFHLSSYKIMFFPRFSFELHLPIVLPFFFALMKKCMKKCPYYMLHRYSLFHCLVENIKT